MLYKKKPRKQLTSGKEEKKSQIIMIRCWRRAVTEDVFLLIRVAY